MDLTSGEAFRGPLKFKKEISGLLAPILMRFFKLDQISDLYNQTSEGKGLPFIEAVLTHLRIKITIDTSELKNIPAKGAFIAIANHPFGGIDGLLLLKVLATIRPEFKIIANPVLKHLPPIEDFIIPVNPFKMQYQENIPGMRKVLNLVQNDIPIGLFPEVETTGLQTNYKIINPEWHQGLARLVAKARVPVLPIYFSGSNTLNFNLSGLIHSSLRTGQLPAEVLNKEGLSVKIRIGKPIPYAELDGMTKPELAAYLRTKTYKLSTGFLKPNPLRNFINTLPSAKPIIKEIDRTRIKAEIIKLPNRCLLYTHEQYQVYVAEYNQIPFIMQELGRLREITFRAAGEGTNQELDIDLFDQHFQHLFLYDTNASLIVGSYRIGKGKFIMSHLGKSGFYLHSLFKIKKEFIPVLKKSLELGKLFIRPEYQKKPMPLYLLWQGISKFLEGKSQYRYLLGPVSISDYFSATSKAIIVDFIKKHFYDQELASLISSRKKFKYRVSHYYSESTWQKNIKTIESFDELIAYTEPRHLHLPVLLRKYLQKNARIIGFNMDPKFSNSLDGLLIIEIANLPDATQALLSRKRN